MKEIVLVDTFDAIEITFNSGFFTVISLADWETFLSDGEVIFDRMRGYRAIESLRMVG